MEMLRIFVRTLGLGNVEIARRTKIAHANVGRYFRGEARVPLDFVIAVIRALGLEYREFFELAYADQPAQPTEARKKIERILEVLPARRPAASVVEPEPEPEPPKTDVERLLEAFRREVGNLLDARQSSQVIAPPPAPVPEPEPAKPASRRRKKEA
ncbi:MAG TPA: helix-turn-helix transcriptional regulator [Thermoanaerobaculia bacterium]|nr:helix-turn-helix transcriptional regulator [Thermoanaerobaculia bacterium]